MTVDIGEVQANLSFSDLRLGDRVQADLRDPTVRALIKAGYLKVTWRFLDAAVADPAGMGGLPGADLDTGFQGTAEEEALDGPGGYKEQP